MKNPENIYQQISAYISLTMLALVVTTSAASAIGARAQSVETEVAVEMNTFVLSASLNGEWEVIVDHASHQVHLEQGTHIGTPRASSWVITVVEQDANKMWAVPHSEQWMADDYRRGEEADMIARGVMTGMYQLEDLEKSEVDVQGKHLYTMTYGQLFPEHIGHGYLYLYFPPDISKNPNFYAFHYFDLHPKRYPHDVTLADFHAVISGFVLKVLSDPLSDAEG